MSNQNYNTPERLEFLTVGIIGLLTIAFILV